MHVTLKLVFYDISGTWQTEAPLKDHKNILQSLDEIFRFNEFGAQQISVTLFFCTTNEFN